MKMLYKEQKTEVDIFSPFDNRERSSLEEQSYLEPQSTKATAILSSLRDLSSRCRCHVSLRALLDSLIGGPSCRSAGRRYERTREPFKVPDIGELQPFNFWTKPSGSLNKHFINELLAGLYTGEYLSDHQPHLHCPCTLVS